MSAPLFLVDAGRLGEPGQAGAARLTGSPFRLDGSEGRHAADVQRLGVGEQLLLADGHGRVARCTIITTGKGLLDVRIEEAWDETAASLRLVLAQALAKGDRDLMAIEAATELDVDEVVPWQADRSIVRWRAERGDKARRKWEQTVLAATKQSRRAWLPRVAELATRHTLSERARQAELTLVLHEEAAQPLTSVELPTAGEVLLVVGPEGGISPAEVDALVEAGAVAVRLGRTVLRTSTAGAAALAVLNARSRWG